MAIRHVMADGRRPLGIDALCQLKSCLPSLPTRTKTLRLLCGAPFPLSPRKGNEQVSSHTIFPGWATTGLHPPLGAIYLPARQPVHLVPPLIPRAVSERPPCRPQGARTILLPGARLARASVLLPRPRHTHDGGAGLGGQEGRVQPRPGPLRPRLVFDVQYPG